MEDLTDRVGQTKIQILESCLTPKSWGELKSIIKKSEPTLLVHINDLNKMRLLEKNENDRKYLTTEHGIDFLKLQPHMKSTLDKRPKEIRKMVQRGIKLGNLTLKEKFKFELFGLDAIRYDKYLNKTYKNVAKAIQQSVTIWLPNGIIPDKKIYDAVTGLIALCSKSNKEIINDKMTITIEVDFKTAFDLILREEQDEEIKKRLMANRDKIIEQVTHNWYRITK